MPLLKTVREQTSLDVKRTDFKLDMVPAHLFMNLRVVTSTAGSSAWAATWRAEGGLGAQARGAFQALAG
jgi:ATP-dependent helicase HrpA